MRTARSSPSSAKSTTRSLRSTSTVRSGYEAEEIRQRGQHHEATEAERHLHAQAAAERQAAAGQDLLGFLDVVQDPPAALEERLAVIGERHPPRGAVEELHAQAALQARDRLGDGRPGNRQLLGGWP